MYIDGKQLPIRIMLLLAAAVSLNLNKIVVSISHLDTKKWENKIQVEKSQSYHLNQGLSRVS